MTDQPTTSRAHRIVGWTIFSLGFAIQTAIVIVSVQNGQPLVEVVENDWTYHLMSLGLVTVGALTIGHQPSNRVSWLFAWTGLLLAMGELTSELAAYGYANNPEPSLIATTSAWISNWVWVVGFGPLATLLLLWFPTGRPPSPWWRWVERAALGIIIPLSLLVAFGRDPESTSGIPNPLEVDWVTAVGEAVFVVVGPLFPMVAAASAISLFVRFHRARGDERQQIKWFMLAAACLAVFMIIDTAVVSLDLRWNPVLQKVLEVFAFGGLPAAAGIAIFKYRLYDIDIIINRALVYGALTAILAAAYFGLVVAFQRALDPVTQQSDVAVAASTLAVAALFGPVRRRVQDFIDRRFYRARYDAQKTLESFSARLRDEVELEHLSSELLGVVATTMRPRHASLWLRGEAS